MRTSVTFWFVFGAAVAMVVAWLSARIHASGHAPFGLTSFFVGAVLGIAIGAIASKVGVTGVRTLVIGAVVFSLITIIGEHAWLYREYCRQWRDERTRSAAAAALADPTPSTIVEWLDLEWNPLLWLTDAALITVTAAATAVSASRYRIAVARGPDTRHPTTDT